MHEPLSWANTQLVTEDAIEVVKESEGRAIRLDAHHGSSLSLRRSLLNAGLVDRFRVAVLPVITGSTGNERIYEGYPDVGLEMINSRTFDGRIQLQEYVPTVLDGPPTTTTDNAS